MDPNITLAEMRQYTKQATEGIDVHRAERMLRWLFEDLDEWLSKGGFPPKDWQQ